LSDVVRTFLAIFGLLVWCAPPAAAATVSAYPLPGTRTAGAHTQISLRGAPPAQLGAIVVTGSRSGRHTGSLRTHSDGMGASYVLTRPFRAGERVTVRTALDIAGARNGNYGFTVARRPPQPATRPAELPKVGMGAVQRFVTRPDLVPPAAAVTTRQPGAAPGFVFVAPKGGHGQDGPMILDDAGHVVWFHPAGNREEATDFRVQTYQGRPVLTWWQGRLVGGEGRGEGVIYDEHYRPVRRVRAGNGFSADLHEFQLTPQGTALLLSYDRVKMDLRPYGGSRDGTVVDGVVQEIDVATGLVLFEWHSVGHVSPRESTLRAPTGRAGWDYVHLNSVALDPAGDFIVSSRRASTVYKIDRHTGRIAWRMGGKASTLKMGPGTTFHLQHDVRSHPGGTITLFDNSAPPAFRKSSRAVTIRVDETRATATLVRALKRPDGLLSATQGSVQTLANGNTFVGWGSQRWFTEFDSAGNAVYDGHLAAGNDTYRAYRLPWTGTPAANPRIVARRGSGVSMTVRASFNGATGVARWQLLAGDSPGTLQPVSTVPKTGFETAITAPRRAYVAMRALAADGTTLGTSPTVRPAG
jgi:hypothetical protein